MFSEILNYRKIYEVYLKNKLVILYYSYGNNSKCQPVWFFLAAI